MSVEVFQVGDGIAVATPRHLVTRSSAFSPASLSGLQMWLKAEAIAGLNDGDPVAQWNDQSGHNNHATQAVLAMRPAYKVNMVNGKPAVRFDAVDDWLVFGTQILTGMTIFAVARHLDQTSCLVGNAVSGLDFLLIDTGPLLTLVPSFSPAVAVVAAINSWQLYGGWIDGVNIQASVNLTNSGLVANANSITLNTVGAYALNSTWLMNGEIAEVILYDRACSLAERTQIQNYFNQKYALF